MHRKFKNEDSSGNIVETTTFIRPNDLLPGIEEFLCSVLAKESLTTEAEEQRQYFIERLDIIKLPPSVPPRPHSLGLQLCPITNGTLPTESSSIDSIPEHEDFAAYQRELSRALVAKGDTSTGSGEEEVKVYDDIELKDDSTNDGSHIQPEDEDSMYEIPQIKRSLSDSGYEKAIDAATLSKTKESPASVEPTFTIPAVPQPPPLPPRRERTASDAASRSSIASLLDEKMQESGLKLDQQNSISSVVDKQFDNKSIKSSDDPLEEYTGDEIDSVSVDSLDQEGGVKLPRAMKKKKHHHKVTQSLSAPIIDISRTLNDLDEVLLSGELYYKSTLLSTKNMVAISNNRLVCYRHDKTDCKPVLVIPLTGYRATFHKRHSRQSYEIQLFHDVLDDHAFHTVFKEWAQTWCEYINCVSDGRKVAGPHYNLVRNRSMERPYGSTYDLVKSSSKMYGSSVSVSSYDGLSTEPGSGRIKKRNSSGSRQRMGSIASMASQFFDTLLKRSSTTGPSSGTDHSIPEHTKSSAHDDSREHYKHPEKMSRSSGDSASERGSTHDPQSPQSPLTPQSAVFEPTVIVTPVDVPKEVKHQGFLNIYSSFNKRKWGKRWCKVLENNFECYRSPSSSVCELDFLLRGCILKRAIEETKSQLGLMLMENNREKITVEPLNWSELGSWLRVLMGETSTPKPPEGLEGYMEESHQYHDIIESTQSSDHKSSTNSQAISESKSERTDTNDNISWRNTNRDSGNCSAESIDGKFDSLERAHHQEFSDSSLPRAAAHKNSDIYSIVRKTSTIKRPENQNDKKVRTHSKHAAPIDKTKSIIPIKKAPADDNHSLDFGSTEEHLNSLEQEGSMVDEVLSKFTSQISCGFVSSEEEKDSEDAAIDLKTDGCNSLPEDQNIWSSVNELQPGTVDTSEYETVRHRRTSRDLTELDVISPIKETSQEDDSERVSHKSFMCSSFLEETKNRDDAILNSNNNKTKTISDDDATRCGDTVINSAEGNPGLFTANAENSEHPVLELGTSDKDTVIGENKTVKSESYEICVDTLTDVLSNLSLEDTGTGNTGTGDESKGKDASMGAELNEDSCDIKPLGVNTRPLLDDEARTRRSVVIREMAETGGDIIRTLQELRTKLVELKKDRISIHDRMLSMSSERDRVYLEDEYNRLNRECNKVNEEIACIEELQQERTGQKKIFEDDADEIDV